MILNTDEAVRAYQRGLRLEAEEDSKEALHHFLISLQLHMKAGRLYRSDVLPNLLKHISAAYAQEGDYANAIRFKYVEQYLLERALLQFSPDFEPSYDTAAAGAAPRSARQRELEYLATACESVGERDAASWEVAAPGGAWTLLRAMRIALLFALAFIATVLVGAVLLRAARRALHGVRA